MNITLQDNAFGNVSKITFGKQLEGIVIEHDHCQAKISLYGGQVLLWQPKNQKPVFWLSEDSFFEQSKAIRGGIPLCWPWFGAHWQDADNINGNHGFARQHFWQLDSIDINKDNVTVVLSLSGQNQHPLWPNAYQLKQKLTFGQAFSQQLEICNLSAEEAKYTGALHSYFCVSDPKNIRVKQLSQVPYDDKITGELNNKADFVDGQGPVDRIYHCNKNMRIVDKQWQRTIEIEPFNSNHWVFWNPGKVQVDKMVDVHNEAEKQFICLEVANTEPCVLPSDITVVLGQTIRVLSN